MDQTIPLSEVDPPLDTEVLEKFPEVEKFLETIRELTKVLPEVLRKKMRSSPAIDSVWQAMEKLSSLWEKEEEFETALLAFLLSKGSSREVLLDLKSSILELVETLEEISSMVRDVSPEVNATVGRLRAQGELLKGRAEEIFEVRGKIGNTDRHP